MNESADFVMYWWDRAAELLTRKGAMLRRFGFVTTNSISQVFQRRVMEKHLGAKQPISLVMAIADHPWTKATADAAAVRIAMTVCEAGGRDGVLNEVVVERNLDTDAPVVELLRHSGTINSDLTVGVDVTSARALESNTGICSPGVKLHGAGFIVTPQEAKHLGLGRRAGLEKHIRNYRHGRDLTARPRAAMVIDLFGLTIDDVRKRFPEVYQHLSVAVKPERDRNNRETYKTNWWIFGEPRKDLRPALEELPRYIATVETTKHRVFQFLDGSTLPDNMLVAIATDDRCHLGVLSSRSHAIWTTAQGGTLEDRPRYTKSRCFDPFPFPDANNIQKQTIRLIAEDLDAHRKRVLAEHPHLTLTGLYNVLEKVRAGTVLSVPSPLVGEGQGGGSDEQKLRRSTIPPSPPLPHKGEESRQQWPLTLSINERRIFDDGLVLILKELHDRLDAAVVAAYGWPADIKDDEILGRLVALNKERNEEEKRGRVRWLRPDYQIPRFAKGIDKQAVAEDGAQVTADLVGTVAQKRAFPANAVEQTAAVFAALATIGIAIDAKGLADQFRKTRTTDKKIAAVLASLARLGYVTPHDGKRFALRRVA